MATDILVVNFTIINTLAKKEGVEGIPKGSESVRLYNHRCPQPKSWQNISALLASRNNINSLSGQVFSGIECQETGTVFALAPVKDKQILK